MNKPVQYYLLKHKGFKRVITEYLLNGDCKWQLEPIKCDDEDVYKWNPPENIKKLPRAKL